MAEGTSEVSGGISGVNEAARQTGAAAEEVLIAARVLSRNGEALKAEIDAFLLDVRAA
jgi:methyl-accepting chemotaxis protein